MKQHITNIVHIKHAL